MLLKKCRKVSFAIICFIICMLASITVFAASDNLLIDPDWDSGFDAWVDEAINATAVQNGKTIMYSKAYQDVPLAEPAGGQKLVLSAYLRVREFQECIDMGLIICKADGSHISDLMESESGTEWAYHEIATEVPPEASYARVYLTIWKNDDDNTFGFDDLCLTENTDSPVLTVDEPDRTCKGQWVFDGLDSWTGTMTDKTEYSEELGQAKLIYPTDGATFIATCGFPGEVIEGGETAFFPMSMAYTDVTLADGFRLDSCWLAATAFDVENPHDLFQQPYLNCVKFVNIDDPDDDRAICHGTIWADPANPDNVGIDLETKTASWRFPYGIRDGETLTVWFVDSGANSDGPALGWRYVWQSQSDLQPLSEDSTSVDVDYKGDAGAWVMDHYEVVYPDDGSREIRDMKDMAVYLNRDNDQFTLAYLNSGDMEESWGFFESIFDCPPEVIKDHTTFTINITTNSLGGYAYALSNGTSFRSGKNVNSWEEATFREEMWDEEESRYYSSVTTSGDMRYVFDSKTKPFTMDLFRSGPNKPGDTLTIVYDAGPVVAFHYVWVEGTSSE